MANQYHAKTSSEAIKLLESSPIGLSSNEAARRLAQYGPNEIKDAAKISPLKIFLKQFDSMVIWILMFATVVSAFLHEYIDAIVIGVILVLIAVLGFFQEYRAEKAIEALKRLASLKAKVMRDGKRIEIDSKDLVPGDIIIIEAGDKVPADARLIEAVNLKTQEAALTGESQPVTKNIEPVAESASLGDRLNSLFSGTICVNGRGKAVVISTGMQTEIGKIATLIEQAKPEPTPLQVKMDQLGKVIGIIVLAIAAIIFVMELVFDPLAREHLITGNMVEFLKEATSALISAIAVAVAAIPEGLPAVVTISLALGTQRMLKRNALVRRLPSVETLGSTTVICSDKTGTLTKNEMTVRRIYTQGKEIEVTGSGYSPKGEFLHKGKPASMDDLEMVLSIGALNNDSQLSNSSIMGDPTEGALVVAAAKAGFSKKELESHLPREDEIEFTSERKLMTTLHRHHGEQLAYVKGAPEIVLSLCTSILEEGDIRKLTEDDKKKILAMNHKFADSALRVLGFAYRTVMKGTPRNQIEKSLVFVGMQGMMDPAREEVKVAIERCNEAGIRVVMITGDQELTAKAVAREIGIVGKSMTGAELEKINDLESVVEDIGIFARVNPEHKLKIVDALKKKGHVVAMTGDGVNDAPALKRADIGVAMGITGTDVSKEASSIILTDDNFASIVNAVEEGRGTYDNIRKYFGFLISGNIGEVMIIFLGIIFGLPLPLTATQILLINLVTDGLPALALSADPFEPHAMKRKPRKKTEPIYQGLTPFMVLYPILMTIASLSVFCFFFFGEGNLLKAQTATFLTISMFELYQAFTCRSTIYPSWQVGYFKNKWLILAVGTSVSVIAASIFIPTFGAVLGMAPLSVMEFLAISALSSIGAIAIEFTKLFNLRKRGNERLG